MTEEARVAELIKDSNFILVLAGAGLSADSGIPTFRGRDGFWTVGSKNYFPEELATFSSFRNKPQVVWDWYRYRIKKYMECKPSEGHLSLVKLEEYCKKRGKSFLMITQNVDGLSKIAGSKNLIEIHGNISYMRCSDDRSTHYNELVPVDYTSEDIPKCQRCGEIMRPHVLWFDETYNETLFSADTALRAAYEADLLIVIGTTLMTTLPHSITSIIHMRRKPIVEVNPEPVLEGVAEVTVVGNASSVLPKITEGLEEEN